MSRIDSHVSRVRNKLMMAEFLHVWAQTLLVAALIVLAYAVVRQFALFRVPRELTWLSSVAAATVLISLIVAVARRPQPLLAAVAIDQRLGLKEKFSTALHARASNDPFSQAAVLDAEQTAAKVDLQRQFPLSFPMLFVAPGIIALGVVMLLTFVQPRNVFASDDPKPPPKKVDAHEQEKAKDTVRKAIVAMEQAPKAVGEKEAIQMAKAELKELLHQPNIDPAAANRKALSAIQDLEQANKEHIKNNQKYATAKANEKQLEKLEPGGEEKGPVADAQRALAKGDFDSAMEKLEDTVKKFDDMTEDQKQNAAKQMEQMANQLKKMAEDPAQQERAKQELQSKLGMNQQQAQQAMQAMQQAAQGNKQAQQQVQQMAQQAMQQMNGGQGATQAQQQQVQQMMQALQGQANGQQQAAALQQAAAQMAGAMQQAAAQQGQQANGAQQAQQGQQGQGQQGQGQQGQQGQQGGQQQMAQAQQAMQQQLQNMQAMAQDAKQVAAAQQAAQQAGQQAQAGMNPGQGQGQGQGGQGQQPGQGQGQGQGGQAQGGGQGNQNQKGNGQGGPGIGNGGDLGMAEAPFTVSQEVSKSEDIEKGRVIAASYVKAEALKGESKAEVQNVAKSAIQDATDEIDSERVGRQAQKVVKDYFGSIAADK